MAFGQGLEIDGMINCNRQNSIYYRILAHIMCPHVKRAPPYSARFFHFQFKTNCITRTTLLRAHGMNASIVVIYTLNHTSSCFVAFKLFCKTRVQQMDLISSKVLIAFEFVDNFISIRFHVYFLK